MQSVGDSGSACLRVVVVVVWTALCFGASGSLFLRRGSHVGAVTADCVWGVGDVRQPPPCTSKPCLAQVGTFRFGPKTLEALVLHAPRCHPPTLAWV